MQNVEHHFYEVGTSLLAKPQALCDIVELEGAPSTLVFCNSPSDADFADVILKKRGITSLKLVGYVPQLKLSKALLQVQKREVSVLVLTDVAARGVPLEDFAAVVNYSIPTDPEVYFHRYASESAEAKQKVISLVAPLDISNFHYLKKLGTLEFVQKELPAPEALFVAKYGQLKTQALEGGYLSDPSVAALVDKVIGDEHVKDVVAMLINNTLTVLPAMKAAQIAAAEESAGQSRGDNESGEDDEFEDNRGNGSARGRGPAREDRRGGSFGGRNDGGRDSVRRGGNRGEGRRDDYGDRGGFNARDNRGSDDSRGSSAGSSERFREDDRQPRGRGRSDRNDRGGFGENRERSREGRDRGGDSGGEFGRDSRPPRQPRREMQVDKEARLYIGNGSEHGVTADKVKADVIAACGVAEADIHKVSVRGHYTFVDLPDAHADQVIEKLSEVDAGKSGKYFVKRAVTLSIPREGSGEGELEGTSSSDSSDERAEGRPERRPRRNTRSERSDVGTSEDGIPDDGGMLGGDFDADNGPTLLAVDE